MANKPGGRPLPSCGTVLEHSDMQITRISLQASPPHSAPYRILQEERKEKNSMLQEQLAEKDQYISRLQEALRLEREKMVKLQSRFNQQGAELRRREQHINRMRDKLSQFTDRPRDRGLSVEILNTLPKPAGRREAMSRAAKADARKDQALQLMLERREAELREAMKLRHSLTTLLHALRNDMHQSLQENKDIEGEVEEGGGGGEEEKLDTSWLVQSEQSLGDHVTGGVVLEWSQVQKRLRELQEQSPVAMRTDQEKLLAQLEQELGQSRELVRVQQQLLQDSVNSPLPDPLLDSYYLEEWERLQDRWVELKRQRRSFQQERQAFTDAAIRLGHERCLFEQQKAAVLKQHFLDSSPITKTSRSNRRESTALGDLRVMAPDSLCLSPCAPITPSSEGSEGTPWSDQKVVMTPSTPELYSALQLPYYCRSAVDSPLSVNLKKNPQQHVFSPKRINMDDWPF